MNLQKLNEFWTGELKDNKLKEGQEPPPNISKEQVWSMSACSAHLCRSCAHMQPAPYPPWQGNWLAEVHACTPACKTCRWAASWSLWACGMGNLHHRPLFLRTQGAVVLLAKDHVGVSQLLAALQAGLFIWQLLYPNSKPGKEKREESVKLGLVEVRGAGTRPRGKT